MKKQITMFICVLTSSCMITQNISGFVRSISEFDTLQFRAPYSLTEILHDGLLSVEQKIQSSLDFDDVVPVLQASALALEDLTGQYDQMINKSNMNTMHRDARESLQKMIDRIDQLINTLEQTKSLSGVESDCIEQHHLLLAELSSRLQF